MERMYEAHVCRTWVPLATEELSQAQVGIENDVKALDRMAGTPITLADDAVSAARAALSGDTFIQLYTSISKRTSKPLETPTEMMDKASIGPGPGGKVPRQSPRHPLAIAPLSQSSAA